MNQKFGWPKILRTQERSGWCGPAVIQMVLLAAGINLPQKTIAKEVYLPWWGTNQQTLIAYLSKFFQNLGYLTNAQISNLDDHLEKGHLLIVNWWDDPDNKDAEGHYSLVVDHHKAKKTLTLADPTTGRGLWEIEEKKFLSRWYDYLDFNQKIKTSGFLLWIEPRLKI